MNISRQHLLGDIADRFRRQQWPKLAHRIFAMLISHAGRGQIPAAIPANPAAHLSEAAIEMLLNASVDKNGLILKVETLDGRYFTTNGQILGLSEQPQIFARYDYGLNRLIDADPLAQKGPKGQVFVVTGPGFRLAEEIREPRKARL